MARDRLAALKAARGESSDESGDGSEIMIKLEEGPKFMESFFNEVTIIEETLDHLTAQIEEMKKFSAAIASPLNESGDEDLEALMLTIKKSATKVKNKLKEIETTMNSMEGDKSSALYRIRFTQHSALSKRFADIMHQYNNAQIEYREKCKQVIKAQLEVTGNSTTDEGLEELLESKDPEIFTQRILTDTKAAKQTLADITARHADIIKLEKSIKELHDLFLDMAVLVDSQGDMVDRIEHQVIETKNYVAKANEETAKAVIYHKKARRKKTVIYLCLIIILIVIIATITLSLIH